MKTYFVTWVMRIEAETHAEAAALALAIQQEPDTLATRFIVRDIETEEEHVVDVRPHVGSA